MIQYLNKQQTRLMVIYLKGCLLKNPTSVNTVEQVLLEKKLYPSHVCEKKRRHPQKKEKHVSVRYYAFTQIL